MARLRKAWSSTIADELSGRLNRRQFLAVGAGLALAGTLPRVANGLPAAARATWVTVYRLSTHGRRTCGACKAHAANKYFRTREAAEMRAHPGCNCAVVTQRIPFGVAKHYFRGGDVFDRRRTA